MNAQADFLHAHQRRGRPGIRHVHSLGWHLDDWSDFEITFRISGRIIVKKRSHIVIRMGPRWSIGYSSEYKKWQNRAAAEIAEQWQSIFPHGAAYPLQSETRFNLRVVTYFEDKRSVPDLCASYEGPQDVLEAHKGTCREDCAKHGGVYVNDKFVCGHVGSDRLLDPDDPRVELTLTPHRPEAR